MFHEPDAARLRRTRQLWPENLSDQEIMDELRRVRADDSPLTLKMLVEEAGKRGLLPRV